jgi:hypothetical protein
MPEAEFVVYVTNPGVVGLDDDYWLEPGNLPQQLPISPPLRGRNRAERLVDLLRQHHARAEFVIRDWPPDEYVPEQAMIAQQCTSAEKGNYGCGIKALTEMAIWLCGADSGGPTDLPPLANTDPQTEQPIPLEPRKASREPRLWRRTTSWVLEHIVAAFIVGVLVTALAAWLGLG